MEESEEKPEEEKQEIGEPQEKKKFLLRLWSWILNQMQAIRTNFLAKPWIWISIALVGAVLVGVLLCIPANTVKYDSRIEFNWIARNPNGMVIDTNIKEVAEQAGLKLREDEFYLPTTTGVNELEGPEGIAEALVGMKPGEKQRVFIPPEKAYLNARKDYILPRFQEIPLTQNLTLAEFKKSTGGSSPQLSMTLPHYLGGWQVRITKLNESQVSMTAVTPQVNHTWDVFPGWKAKVVEVKNRCVLLEYTLERGLEFRRHPDAFPFLDKAYTYRVEKVGPEKIWLSFNPYEKIAEQGIWFELEVVQILE
jgi:FKBP-type peptidyl-prolyl cis-trans isomerase 2